MSTVRIEIMSFSSRTLLSHCTELIGLKVHCALKTLFSEPLFNLIQMLENIQ